MPVLNMSFASIYFERVFPRRKSVSLNNGGFSWLAERLSALLRITPQFTRCPYIPFLFPLLEEHITPK